MATKAQGNSKGAADSGDQAPPEKMYRVSLLSQAGSMDFGPEVHWEKDSSGDWQIKRKRSGEPEVTGRGTLKLMGGTPLLVSEAYAKYMAGTGMVRIVEVTPEELEAERLGVQGTGAGGAPSGNQPLTLDDLKQILADPAAIASLTGLPVPGVGTANYEYELESSNSDPSLRARTTQSVPKGAKNADVTAVSEKE